jgi:hypothetical protein
MNKKIFSIAPSFNCQLSCEGCYLTTDVTKEMRNATKSEAYYLRAIETAAENGYTDFAITWNPFPGSFEMTKKYVIYAKSLGFNTSVTTVLSTVDDGDREFYKNLDVLTISVDDMRFESIQDFTERNRDLEPGLSLFSTIVINYNLLWTPTVFKWLYENEDAFGEMLESINYPNTVQHLIYKPLSIYEQQGFNFWENYQRVFTEYPWVNIAGDGKKYIGDIALNNLLGINNCPGEDFQMVDVDPMGQVRRCPENPISYDGGNIYKLKNLLADGTSCKSKKCNCITG